MLTLMHLSSDASWGFQRIIGLDFSRYAQIGQMRVYALFGWTITADDRPMCTVTDVAYSREKCICIAKEK